MYLSILRLWNFRKYGTGADNAPGLEVHFHEGVNVLVGENDSGKTTIVDAIRYALKTQSGEFIQFDDKDFYQDVQGNRMDEFKIECVFDGLNEQDSGLFWEWLSWNECQSQEKNRLIRRQTESNIKQAWLCLALSRLGIIQTSLASPLAALSHGRFSTSRTASFCF